MRGRAHARLRDETRETHAALDATLDLGRLASRAYYLRYLKMNLVCAAMEPALTAAGIQDILPDWEQRQRRFALAGDLAALGAEAGFPPPLTIEADTGTMLGWAYVLEGSRMGARLILRTVAARGDAEMREATRFLRHGDGLGLWERFLAVLAGIDHDEAAIAKARVAANLAFACFLQATCVETIA